MTIDSLADRYSLPSLLPLTLPEEVWNKLDADTQHAYDTAQGIVDFMQGRPEIEPQLLVDSIDVEPDVFVSALKLLFNMGLIAMGSGISLGGDALGGNALSGNALSGNALSDNALKLVALPDEHLSVVGLDGKRHWVFVARPLTPPNLAYEQLN